MNKKKLLSLVFSLVTFLGITAGVANALPLTLQSSDGATYDTWTGNGGAGGDATFDAGTVAGSLPEHKYATPAANQSNGPHGKFTTDTNACGRCHQLHQAKSARLIRFDTTTNTSAQNPIYAICTYCHNFNGQSTYDVKDGMIWDSADGKRYATNGGGFERQLVVEGAPEAATLVKANSSHRVNEAMYNATEYLRFNAPGASSSEHIDLRCSSCHNPHGSSNARILAESVAIYNANTAGATALRATVSNMPQYVTARFGNEASVYPDDISNFCGTCHTDYLNTTNAGNSGSVASGTTGNYRHMINMTADSTLNNKVGGGRNDGSFGYESDRLLLPLGTTAADPIGAPGSVNIVVCTTCHFAHGTGAEMTQAVINNTTGVQMDVASSPGRDLGLLTANGNIMSETIKNLRLDNRAVCQNCHNRNSVANTAADQPRLADVLDPASTGAVAYSGSKLAGVTAKGFAGKTFIVVRFDQYMKKDTAETVGNYTYSSGAVTDAKLQPDGRTVYLTVSAAPTINTSTVSTTANIKNINNVSAIADTVTVK